MSSPFSLFRKYQKSILAVVCVVCIIVFTIELGLNRNDTREGGGRTGSETAVSWKTRQLSEGELRQFGIRTRQTQRFIDSVVMDVMQKGGGQPKTPLYFAMMRSRQQGPQGILPALPASEQDIVHTLLLAERGAELGVSFSDDAVISFLNKLSDDTLKTKANVAAQLARLNQPEFTLGDLFYTLRTHMSAAQVLLVTAPVLQDAAPAAAWDYYKRFNRNLKAELLPLPVDSFLDKVTGTPGEAELKALYEEGKTRYPHPDDHRAAFRRYERATIEYVKFDTSGYFADEMKKITDEQIKTFYEKNKEDFRKPDLPSASLDDLKFEKPEEKKGDEKKPDNAKPEEKTSSEKSDAAPAKGSGDDKAAGDAKEANPAVDTSKEKATDAAPGTNPTEKPAEKSDSKAPGVATDAVRAKVILVSANAEPAPGKDGEKEPAATEKTEAPKTEAPKTEAPKTEAPKTEAPKTEAPKTEAPKTEAPKTEAPKTEAPKTEAPKTEAPKTEAPKTEAPKTEAPKTEGAAGDVTQTPEAKKPEKAPEYRPLSEVQDAIRRTLAMPAVKKIVDQHLSELRSELQTHYEKYNSWTHSKKTAKDAPEPTFPDLAPLLAKANSSHHKLGSVDILELLKKESGQAFAQEVFGAQHPLYQPRQIGDSSFQDAIYVFWITARDPTVTPSFDDAKEAVVAAWKKQAAYELAVKEAENLASSARKNKTPLKESLDKNLAAKAFDTGEFRWLFGFQNRFIANRVENVEGAGDDFHRGLADLRFGEVGVVHNDPRTVVYVARISSDTPNEETMRGMFASAGQTDSMSSLAGAEANRLFVRWMDQFEKRMNVKWLRDPRSGQDDL